MLIRCVRKVAEPLMPHATAHTDLGSTIITTLLSGTTLPPQTGALPFPLIRFTNHP
jgi:hypothetical protein